MVSYGPQQRVLFPALCASWLIQTFVHWAYPPRQVQRLLPEGLAVDTCDGRAWVSLTPFVMAAVRPPGSPAALPSFAETNLRTYVRRRDGRDGLWFLSIEVACPVMLAARAIGAPYHLGRLELSRDGDVVTYAGVRGRGGPSYRVSVRPGEPLRPAPRDVWLTSRWRAFTRSCGLLWETPVEHEPWVLSTAHIEDLDETLTRATGLPPPAEEPLVHFSDGVHKVRLAVSRPVRPQETRQTPWRR
ncbi:YqjF family protein [Streptomyces sp. NPDC001020]